MCKSNIYEKSLQKLLRLINKTDSSVDLKLINLSNIIVLKYML